MRIILALILKCDVSVSFKRKIKKSDPVMGAKSNLKTYLQTRFCNFLSNLSEGPKSYDCTKTLGLCIH
jgi:hypothetical protein